MKKRYIALLSLLLLVLVVFKTGLFDSQSYAVLNARRGVKSGNADYAIKNFEKSFTLGNKNATDRELYVDLLIQNNKGALTQKKLLDFYNDNINDYASSKASDFLFDKEDEVIVKYPKNYITQAPYNHKILRWGSTELTYAIVNPEDAPEYFTKEIENAFKTWTNALGKEFSFKRIKYNPNITIVFHKEQTADNGGNKYVTAYTRPEINENELLGMQIDFYVKDLRGEIFSPNKVYNTALHEIGHTLGIMGHSDDRRNVLYISAGESAKNDRASLTDADINTIKLLYATMPEITDKMPEDADYIPYVVSGNNKRVTENKLKEARNYIQKAPELPNGYIDLAEVFVTKKEYNKALNYLKKALTLTENYELIKMIYYDLAVVYNLDGQYDEAESALKKAMDLGDRSENSRHLLARIYASKGNKAEAITEYQKLIIEYPDDINYAIDLANIYIQDKKFFKARGVLKEFVKNNPDKKDSPQIKAYGIWGMF